MIFYRKIYLGVFIFSNFPLITYRKLFFPWYIIIFYLFEDFIQFKLEKYHSLLKNYPDCKRKSFDWTIFTFSASSFEFTKSWRARPFLSLALFLIVLHSRMGKKRVNIHTLSLNFRYFLNKFLCIIVPKILLFTSFPQLSWKPCCHVWIEELLQLPTSPRPRTSPRITFFYSLKTDWVLGTVVSAEKAVAVAVSRGPQEFCS